MAAPPAKKFKIQYTGADGERVTEEPRFTITADGKHKALLIGERTVLASVPFGAPDAELWNKARAARVLVQ